MRHGLRQLERKKNLSRGDPTIGDALGAMRKVKPASIKLHTTKLIEATLVRLCYVLSLVSGSPRESRPVDPMFMLTTQIPGPCKARVRAV